MTFGASTLKLATRAAGLLPAASTVVELGNQTLTARADLIMEAGRLVSGLRRNVDESELQRISGLQPAEKKDKVGALYRALGFAEHVAIDVNQTYGSLMMDLNQDLDTGYRYTRTFDLVTNFGTGEHVFNQLAVFRNMHQLAKVGGLLALNLPFFNNLNHGFFNFSPGLFLDLAAANKYDCVHLGLAASDTEAVVRPLAASDARIDGWRWRELPEAFDVDMFAAPSFLPAPLSLRSRVRGSLGRMKRRIVGHPEPVIRPKKLARLRLGEIVAKLTAIAPNVQVVGILRKTSAGSFRIPIQGKYREAIESDDLRQQYA